MATGQVQVLSKLADGATSEIYQALDASGRQVVLKVLRSNVASDPTMVARFLDEAALCETLEHPNLLRHMGAGQLPDGRLYLVTEYLDGLDLGRQVHEGGPLAPADVVRLAAPLCSAIDYLHGRSIIHRDLKTDNVFLAGGLGAFHPVLLDLGLATFPGRKAHTTSSGAIIPTTAEFAAPEFIEGLPADRGTDIYALGVLLFEALTGHAPFQGSNYEELLLKQLHEPPPPLPPRAAHLTAAIHRCLAKRSQDRFISAGEVAAALAQAQAFGSTQVSRPNPTPGAPIALVEEPTQKSGDVLGPYEILEQIGEGAMGRVYVAKHRSLGRRVAIKVLRHEYAQRSDIVARFFDEAKIVNQINHEHIVEILDFVQDRGYGCVYCVMELLAGRTLTEVLHDGPLPLRRTLNLAWQISSALWAAHQIGVVHRDVKGDNIFVTQRSGLQDFVKVLDFGVAKLVGTLKTDSKVTTQVGTIVGTPSHMAPEQFVGSSDVDHRADIYAFGVLLFTMLAGRLPFDDENVTRLSLLVIRQPAPPVGEFTAGGEPIPHALQALVARCLAKEPQSRPASMLEVFEGIQALLGGEATPEPRRRRGRAAAGAVAAAALLVLGGWLALRPRPSVVEPPHALKAAPAMVTLDLRSTPAGAQVTRVDTGEILGNTPVTRDLPRADRSVPLRFTLKGYQDATRSVRLSSDAQMEASLTPVPAPAPVAAQPQGIARTPKPSSALRPRHRLESADDTVDPFAN
ncbi:MAG: serine/threonine-protein kinase [Myxococcales bacterium]